MASTHRISFSRFSLSRWSRPFTSSGLLALGVLSLLLCSPVFAAQATVNLATAESFAVLAGAGITNSGATTITGDVGSHPTPSQTGFGSVTLNGVNHGADAVTQQAKTNLVTAYNDAGGRLPETAVATELGGSIRTPGVYASNTLAINGTLTLDALGDPSAVFIFKSNSTLTTGSGSQVNLINGANACNVFWRVPSSATLGANSHIAGSVLASTAITLDTGASVAGRLLASTASVTLLGNVITASICPVATPTTTTTTTAASGATTTTVSGAGTGSEAGADSSGANSGRGTGAGRGTNAAGGSSTLADTGLNGEIVLLAVASTSIGVVLLALSAVQRRRQARR